MTASLILDGVTALLILACVIHGCRAGLVHSVFRLLAGVLSLLLAYKLYPLFAGALRATPLYPFLRNSALSALGLDAGGAVTASLSGLPLPGFMTSALAANNNQTVYHMLGADNLAQYIGGYCAYMMVNGIAILAAFVVIRALLAVLSALLRVVTRLPVIHTLNRLGGIVFGALEGLLAVWVLMLALTFTVLAQKTGALWDWLEASALTRYLFEHNVLTQWMGTVFH